MASAVVPTGRTSASTSMRAMAPDLASGAGGPQALSAVDSVPGHRFPRRKGSEPAEQRRSARCSPRVDSIHRIAVRDLLELGQRGANRKRKVLTAAHCDANVLAQD